MVAIMGSFFAFIIPLLLYKQMNISTEAILALSDKSPRYIINTMLTGQIFSSAGLFLLPALLFAYATHPKPFQYLGLRKPEKSFHLLLCIIIILSATPLFLTIAEWMSHINLEAAKAAQEMNDRMMKAFLSMHSLPQLLFSFFVMAILAGFGEELFFRGILLRFTSRRIPSVLVSIIIVALLFALLHSNIYGLPSIFLAGTLLGYFYYLTGSLWSSILAHIVYNGTQVLAVYYSDKNATIAAMNEANHVPVLWTIIGTAICISSFYLLWKTRTSLPANWTDDYTAEELTSLQKENTGSF